MLGDVEVTVLSDGTFPMDASKILTNITPKQLDTDLGRSFLKEPVEMSVNAFLINTASKLVLIDTGCGSLMGPRSESCSRTQGLGLPAGSNR